MNDSHLLDFDRSFSITASVAGAILGLNPYMSRAAAWRSIMGIGKKAPSAAQSWGLEQEKEAMDAFKRILKGDTGKELGPGHYVTSPLFNWIGASPDGILPDGIPVEVKCPVSAIYTTIPAHYYAQVQLQIYCLDAGYGYFGRYDDAQMRYARVIRNDKWIGHAIRELIKFKEMYLLPKKSPPPMKYKIGDVIPEIELLRQHEQRIPY